MTWYCGPKWLLYRVYHAARLKSGYVRFVLPVTSWQEQPLSGFLTNQSLADVDRYAAYRKSAAPRFFFESSSADNFRPYFADWDTAESSPVSIADDLEKGFVRFFSHERVNVEFPPKWHADPVTGNSFPIDRHWSQIGDFSAGDIKLAWETNRFGFTYALVRSYWRTGDERYAECFWKLVEDWHSTNPPQAGINWKCGQEISLRVMAWCFGFYGFAASAASTPQRQAMLAQMLAVSGRRIHFHIDYALSQKNNHGISEALGLWTIGSLFPEFRESSHWAIKGRSLLEKQAQTLIYADGSFSQHSMNYHRLMLHGLIWCTRLGDVIGQPFSPVLRDRLAKAVNFLDQVQEESTGQVPHYGHDDGALILPLSNCDYQDNRPVVQAGHFLITGQRRFESGPWDEDLLWLFGMQSLSRSTSDPSVSGRLLDAGRWSSPSNESEQIENPLRIDFEAPIGGYTVLRSRSGFAMTRAASFLHRPAQADMLHVDIWWRGINIAIDPGTYSYNAAPPWNNLLANTQCHNTVTVDGQNQMDAAGRFLWLPWLKGKSFSHPAECHGDVSCWNGEHNGYRRLSDPVEPRRGLVRLGSEHWLVIDELEGCRNHNFRLHWLLLDAPFKSKVSHNSIELQTSAGDYRVALSASMAVTRFEQTRAASNSTEGWRSAYYHSKEPAISINLEVDSTRVTFATVLGPEAQTAVIRGDQVSVSGKDWGAVAFLNLDHSGEVPLVSRVQASGSLEEITQVDEEEQESKAGQYVFT